jgi:hypothetical protein
VEKNIKQSPAFYIYSIHDESQGTHMWKDIFPKSFVVRIDLPSSTSDYILTKIAWLMVKISKAYWVFEALFLPGPFL